MKITSCKTFSARLEIIIHQLFSDLHFVERWFIRIYPIGKFLVATKKHLICNHSLHG